jgi:hypothetical protein
MGDDEKTATQALMRALRVTLMASGASALVGGAAVTDTGQELGSAAIHGLENLVLGAPARRGPGTPSTEVAAAETVPEPRGETVFRWVATAYSEGDQAPELGRFNMIVPTEEGLALTSSAAAPMDALFSFPTVERDVTVHVQLTLPSWSDQRIALFAGETELVSVVFSGTELVFGDQRDDYRAAGCSGIHDAVSVTVSAGKARLRCNGRFVGVQEVRTLPISSVRVYGLMRKRDYLYSVTANAVPR